MSTFPGKKFDEMTLIEQLRNNLSPQGTEPVVALRLDNRFINADFISACIDELEKMPIRSVMGEPPTKLEQLAYMLLCDSAYIKV